MARVFSRKGLSRRVARWPRDRQRLIKNELKEQSKVAMCIYVNSILKNRDITLPTKTQSYGFSSSHVWM